MVSLFGTWMQSTAQGYLVYELTRSPAYLGYVSFASGIPTWLFMLYAGVIADRIPRRTLLLITQSSMMMLAFILAGLTFGGVVQPWHIVILAAGLGVANAFDAPARLAFVPELVEQREDLTNAIALNATMFNTATMIGPAVAGMAYSLFGPGWCFTINGLSFLAVIAALLRMRLASPAPSSNPRRAILPELRAGFRYVIAHPTIRLLIGLIAIASLFGVSFVTLMPAWAVNVLRGDATTNGLLLSARGTGALISALGIASLGRFRFKGRLLTVGTFVFPIALLVFAQVRWLPLSMAILVVVGASMVLVLNLANALVQTEAADELRGRVMSIYSLLFFGLMPLGSLWVGTLADHTSEPITLTIGALITLGCAALVWLFAPRLRALP